MIVGQTIFSVRTGTEHRAEKALAKLDGMLEHTAGHYGHRILRSFGMSPLASALRDETGEATLGDVHFVVQTEWESLEQHDAFYGSEGLRQAYSVLSSILTSGPYEVLYEEVVGHRDHSGVAV
jgi:heme-degrading monooxygenase HmoA